MLGTNSPQPVVIKIGGEALLQGAAFDSLLKRLQLLRTEYAFVFVHGGGPQVDAALALAQFPTKKIDGQRQTSQQELPLVVGALAGYANQQIIASLTALDWSACGISLSDAGGIPLSQPDLATNVGIPDWQKLDPSQLSYAQLLNTLFSAGITPVVSSIGLSSNNQFLNVNADFAAAAVAILLQAPLLLLSNVDGVLNANGDFISQISIQDIPTLVQTEFVTEGMRVKLEAAYAATNQTRRNSAITSWQSPDLVIAAIQQSAAGTQITL